MMKYTLKNDFHNSKVKISTSGLSHIHNEVELNFSKNQIKRIEKELCGQKDCTCGKIRGPQFTESGKRIVLGDSWALRR